jgi:hypothetical protein
MKQALGVPEELRLSPALHTGVTGEDGIGTITRDASCSSTFDLDQDRAGVVAEPAE